VLDMGEPVRIVDLARDMIKLSGADPTRIAVVFTGLRPGEKLYEEPLASEEATSRRRIPSCASRSARANALPGPDGHVVRERPARRRREVRARLKAWIPSTCRPPVRRSCRSLFAREEANVRRLRRERN
jgi:FlaA1/EpsC-like NDP-sugar epimerase